MMIIYLENIYNKLLSNRFILMTYTCTIDMTWKWMQYFFVQLLKGYDACNNKCKFI